jgi:hypothetical protein
VYTKMADVPVPGFRKYWTQKLASLKSQCHAITSKYPEAASVVQQPAEVGDSSEWASIVNRANFCKALDGKPLSGALCGMVTVFSEDALMLNYGAANAAQFQMYKC